MARRDRSGYAATARATTARARIPAPADTVRSSMTLSFASDVNGRHQKVGGWTEAARAFRPKDRPPWGPGAPRPLARAVRLPARWPISWMRGALQQASAATKPATAHV